MFRWNTVAIYGVGLIGGSIGMALRTKELARHVVGIGRNASKLGKAVELGAITEFCTELSSAPAFDFAVVCTPVQCIPDHCEQLCRHSPAAVLTDAGSTKQHVVEQVEQAVPQARFVGSHPLAGSDRTGVEYAQAELYADRVVVVTPTTHSARQDVDDVCEFWSLLGARVLEMSTGEHDQALAATSHVPHVVASSMAAETPEQYLHLVAGGWRDTTRIAAADVSLWTQIVQENRENVAAALARLRERIQTFENALQENDQKTITRLLAAGKQRRDALGN